MAARLRFPALVVSAISFGLNIAIIGCAGRPLHVFETQRHTNVYFLPAWDGHFDNQPLRMLLGTSAIVAVMNAVVMIALFVLTLPTNVLVLGASALSSLVSLIAVIFCSVANNRAPVKDTLLTWTCRWRTVPNPGAEGVPRVFDSMCHETRFAYYTAIPSFVLQLLLLALALIAVFSARSARMEHAVRLAGDEKNHELGPVIRRRLGDFEDGESVGSSPSRIQLYAKH